MKKCIVCFIVLMSILLPSQSFAINENINNLIYIVVNDELISFQDTYPVVRKGITYVPISVLANHLNITTKWDEKNNSVFLIKGDKEIILDLSVKALFTNEGQIITDCIFLENDRSMAPYKFIANYFDYEVSYIDKGPIARAKNNQLSVKDEDLFSLLQNKIMKEKERVLAEINKKKEEAIRKRLELRKNGKIAYLTFDDGPTKYTGEILDILDEYDCKATFFMLSERIKNNKAVVKEIINNGHSVGLHGVSHSAKKIYRSPATVISEMNICNESLETVVGIRSNLVRVPYGSFPYMKKNYRQAVETAGYKMWDWNVDSKDSLVKYVAPKDILQNVKKQVTRQKVPVILLHERKGTVETLPDILKYLKENRYVTVPIDKNENPINFWNK
ncbi:polysaccharide deacetylase family protein [Marinisporobacter balticus]|uniref:Peptidoglycan/xylan/chitin deacetylase (PgdA/CDA1 family) n=1 Tax=Marinisporobacter balticus TaxID=2018667 RepID=A0A4R2KQH5_9FIRM|nr:polysaccharide deacetylase family protein [Marinisporobacter balticus]TCO74952.1 peptidoglycan/xylan/chitin deacetylase (PgdA/CDA1 family) [Marinisporobacter balticus]